MAIEVTRRWSSRGYGLVNGKWQAERFYDVVGTTAEDAALSAVASAVGDYNSSHPYRPELLCNSITIAESVGPAHFVVRMGYEVPELGQFPSPDDPLSRPYRYYWQKIVKNIPQERQISESAALNGYAIAVSTGSPVDPKATAEIYTRMLIIRRYEPLYDLSLAQAYENTVNNAAGVIGPIEVGIGQMLCHSIEPTGECTAGAPYLEIEYQFEIDTSQAHPFQTYIIDQGRDGWYDDGGTSKRGRFGIGGEACVDDVLLDGTGKPLDSSVKVLATLNGATTEHAPVQTPTASLPNPLDYADYTSSGGAFILIFQQRRQTNFGIFGF